MTAPKLGQPKPHVCIKCGHMAVLPVLEGAKGKFLCPRCNGEMRVEKKDVQMQHVTPPRPKPTPAESCFEFKGIKKNTKQQSFNW